MNHTKHRVSISNELLNTVMLHIAAKVIRVSRSTQAIPLMRIGAEASLRVILATTYVTTPLSTRPIQTLANALGLSTTLSPLFSIEVGIIECLITPSP